jgi:hypothetical protein
VSFTRIALASVLMVSIAPVSWAQYRCVENGKTVFSDRACSASTEAVSKPGKVVGDQQNSAYMTTNGTWRGQVQFMARSGGNVVNEAHAVVPFVIEIDPQGKVVGSAPETGCVLKGIARPGVMPSLTELDVTLTKCAFPKYNRQMSGRIVLYSEKRYVDFSLQAYEFNRKPGGSYEVKGTLRR